MKAKEVIQRADRIKPNSFTDEDKLEWLGTLEGRLMADVVLLGPEELEARRLVYPEDMERELLAQWPHDAMYVQWLMAKIDEANGEYNKYQNSMEIYNEYYAKFVHWFVETYEPARHRGEPLDWEG